MHASNYLPAFAAFFAWQLRQFIQHQYEPLVYVS